MDDTQRIVKCGNLSLHTPGGFFKRRWHSKYLVLYDGSKSGIKRLELFDSEIKFKKQNPAKIIPLVDCVRVVTCQRQKTTYTFEVRTSDQFYLLAAQSFQDMTDWVNCLRLVAFGQSSSSSAGPSGAANSASASSGQSQQQQAAALSRTADYVRSLDKSLKSAASNMLHNGGQAQSVNASMVSAIGGGGSGANLKPPQVSTETHPALVGHKANLYKQQPQAPPPLTTASQAAAAAASALAKTRQRQPSLLGSCKPQPPTDSPFIQAASSTAPTATSATKAATGIQGALTAIGQLDTMTPTVRGQLISSAKVGITSAAMALTTATNSALSAAAAPSTTNNSSQQLNQSIMSRPQQLSTRQQPVIQATLDEEEENMLYCSIEDNPSEHNYRVKVIETELSLRCQLKCYQLTASTTINQQYEQLGQFNPINNRSTSQDSLAVCQPVTFYQLIIGPQELTLLNDYAAAATISKQQQQQGLWSWPYQCIRRYGFDKDNCFMFEAGRKCTSGPGQFIVQTPKAYNIYQDVVKFVNELRSLNGPSSSEAADNQSPMQPPLSSTTTTTTAATTTTTTVAARHHQQDEQSLSPSKGLGRNGISVTQIPVTWTPMSPSSMQTGPPIVVNDLDTASANRQQQQFFDTLRQLDASSSLQSLSAVPLSAQAASKQQQQLLKSQPIGKSQPELTFSKVSSNQPTTLSTSTTSQKQQASRMSPSYPTPPPPLSSDLGTQSSKMNSSPVNETLMSSNKQKKCSSIAGSEETDESGYDQCDDSVDSSAASVCGGGKGSSNNGIGMRNQQTTNSDLSMSSASSTSSGGSPGHSVSKRSAGTVLANTQSQCKRTPLLNTSGNNNGSNNNQSQSATSAINTAAAATAGSRNDSNDKLIGGAKSSSLRNLLSEAQPGDFEANLIRDVYSEITKLHAKFAVTTGGSTEDSLSNISSGNEGSHSDNGSSGTIGVGQDELTSGNRVVGREPMYTNLRRAPSCESDRLRDPFEDEDEGDNDDEEEEELDLELDRHISRRPRSISSRAHLDGQQALDYHEPPQFHPMSMITRDHSYAHQYQHHHQNRNGRDYDNGSNNSHLSPSLQQQPPRCGSGLYPSILNPIPECGELATEKPIQRPTSNKLGNHLISNNNNGNSRVNFIPDKQRVSSANRRTELEKPNNFKKQQQQRAQGNLLKSKLPTNHYVINDVQYAKISRSIRSKYEACL